MMVETILDCSQDFGMSGGGLPQWKRELLQRRAAKTRPAAPPQPPPPPPPPPDDDEELSYGPGIVKRLKSRYLSLALRDAPRRRPSVLRRAASLEHMLDTPPAPTPRPAARPPRPTSMAAPPAAPASHARRESVKRARSVDALSRLDSREDPRAPSPSPPPPAPRPPPAGGRSARPPRRPTPLLRETERPPPDVVRSTLRKFESAPTKRAAPAARVSAVLRGLEGARAPTPDPDITESRESSPPPLPTSPVPTSCSSPAPALPVVSAPPQVNSFSPPSSPYRTVSPTEVIVTSSPPAADSSPGRTVSRAALEQIARAGVSVRYEFPAARGGSHLPPLSATNPVLLGRARRVGVIRPMPARIDPDPVDYSTDIFDDKILEEPRVSSPALPLTLSPAPSPAPEPESPARGERREAPPAALVEPQPRPPPGDVTPAPREPSPERKGTGRPDASSTPLLNGHSKAPAPAESPVSRIGAAGIERAWSGTGARRGRGVPPVAATSVVFNFSTRKEVPDYIENDGIILRNKARFKPGEAGVVVLHPSALLDSDCEPDAPDDAPPSPCAVRFVNDNVLINGKSSMTAAHNKDRIAKLKLQFDDSLTRTHEYPSETSLSESSPPAPPAPPAPLDCAPPQQAAEAPHHAPLADNTHIASAALSRYTPSKTVAASFQLGVTRSDVHTYTHQEHNHNAESGASEGGAACGADVRSWSEARSLATDLLF